MLGLVAMAVFIAALGFGIYRITKPVVLRAAVGPQSSEDVRLVAAIAQLLVRENASVRLKIVSTGSFAESAAAIEAGRADIAVLRSDIAVPTTAQTVAILHRNSAVFIAPARAGVSDIAELAGKRIGLLRSGPANDRLLDTLLTYYNVKPDSVTRVGLQPQDVASAVAGNAVDVVVAFGPVTGMLVADAVSAIASASGAPPVFLPLREAGALAQRQMAFEPVEILRGAFGGTPPTPERTVPTVSVSFQLVARSTVQETVVTELTRHIFEEKADLAGATPLAAYIEAPDTDKGARFVVHPGAAVYLDGDEASFIETYGDWFYIIAMVLGIGVSGGAALLNRWRKQSDDAAARFQRVLSLLREARSVESLARLDALEGEIDDIFAELMEMAAADTLDANRLTAFSLALNQVRHAMTERRRLLDREAHLPKEPSIARV
jgi:TRAP transporter TAXI family solute receptor